MRNVVQRPVINQFDDNENCPSDERERLRADYTQDFHNYVEQSAIQILYINLNIGWSVQVFIRELSNLLWKTQIYVVINKTMDKTNERTKEKNNWIDTSEK